MVVPNECNYDVQVYRRDVIWSDNECKEIKVRNEENKEEEDCSLPSVRGMNAVEAKDMERGFFI